MQQKLDTDLFEKLKKVRSLVDESIWMKDHLRIAHEEREKFFDNEVENPLFSYQNKSKENSSPAKILEMLDEVGKSKVHAVVAELYEKRLRVELVRNDLIDASLTGDDEAFFALSTKLYGKPKNKYFSYVALRLKKICEENQELFPSESKRLLKVVSKISTSEVDIDVSVLPPVVDSKVKIGSLKEVTDIFSEAIERFGVKDWSLVIDTDSSSRSRFSVDPRAKKVFIPSEEQLMSRVPTLTTVQVMAIADHEIGVHARRVHEAEKSNLQILQIGLDNYLPGEEGLAGYVQQQVEGATEFYGFDRYLAASLAVGIDGKTRDFRSVFSLMVDYYTIKLKDEKLTKNAPFRAAWDVCVRIFRGTTGQKAGCIYTKDVVYLEGNIGIWNLLTDKPHVFESLFIGKFNPLSSRHIRSLQTLEILKEW